MKNPLIVADLDRTATNWIEQEAHRSGVPVEQIVRQLIYNGLELVRRRSRGQRHHDLDALAGTWTSAEAEEFNRSIATLDEIDQTLWS